MLELNESFNEQHVDMPIGEIFEIRLPENPTTGFQWSLKSSGEPVCVPLGNVFEPTNGPPGHGGSHYWRFQAAQVGQVNIELVYQRPWERDEKHGEKFTLHVRVPV
jgi:inhibitor of cysteine peptidase